MSRLYAWINSDTRKTALTTRGNDFITIRVHYGSKYNSNLAIWVAVDYPKSEKYPTIHLKVPKNVKVYTHETIDS